MNAMQAHGAAHMFRCWFVVSSLMLGVVFVPVGVAIGVQSAYRLAARELKTPTRTEEIARTLDSFASDDQEFDVTASPRKVARR